MCPFWRLQEFLLEIQASPNVEYGELADILVRQAQSADEVTRMTALRWLRAFVTQAKDQLMPYYAIILAAVLPNVSHNNQDICQVRWCLSQHEALAGCNAGMLCLDLLASKVKHWTCLPWFPEYQSCSVHWLPMWLAAVVTFCNGNVLLQAGIVLTTCLCL